MCGRKYASEELTWAEYREILNIIPDQPSNLAPNYNIAPTHQVLAFRKNAEEVRLSPLHWGLVPHWAKDAKKAGSMINARSETLEEKPSFRPLLKSRRCAVLVSGFYEWQRGLGSTGKDKQAHKVERGDGRPMLLAGLWTRNDALNLESYTIVTTAATPDFAALHHRLPAILEPDQLDLWLTGEWDAARDLLTPYAGALNTAAISNAVGNVRNNGPELLKPI
ncbi:MAG: SOS response-associated peptidase [Parasphingorhabdus sp.]